MPKEPQSKRNVDVRDVELRIFLRIFDWGLTAARIRSA